MGVVTAEARRRARRASAEGRALTHDVVFFFFLFVVDCSNRRRRGAGVLLFGHLSFVDDR